MKKFIVKSFLFVVIGYAFLYGLYSFLVADETEKYEIKKALKIKDQIEAVTIGTSHAWAINFRSLGVKGLGLCVGARDLTECKYLLEYVTSEFKNLKTVFISISYFSLYQDNTPIDNQISDARAYMYFSVPSAKPLPGDYKNYILGRFFPFIQSDHWRGRAISLYWKIMARYSKLKHSQQSLLAAQTANSANSTNTIKTISLKEIQTRVAAQINVHEKAKQNTRYNTKAHSLDILRQIIDLLKGKGVNVIFFTPPYYYKYTELYDQKYIDEVKQEVRKLTTKYGITYLDFSMDSDFIYDAGKFKDPDHLTVEATRIFADKLKPLLPTR